MTKGTGWGLLGFLIGGPALAAAGAALGGALDQREAQRMRMQEQLDEVVKRLRDITKAEGEGSEHTLAWLNETIAVRTARRVPPMLAKAVLADLAKYMNHTAVMLSVLFKASAWSDLEQEVATLFQEALAYFEQEEDLIPDDEGFVGFLDDCYLAGLIVQKIAESNADIARLDGMQPLVEGNELVRHVLPLDVLSALEARVGKAMQAAGAQKAMTRMAQQSAMFQQNWRRASTSSGYDMKRDIVMETTYHDLARDGYYVRPGTG